MSRIDLHLRCSALPGSDGFQIVSCDLDEGTSRPTRAKVEIFSQTLLDEQGLLDQPASWLAMHGSAQRQWSFVVEAVNYVGFRDGSHRYWLDLVHPLGLLARRSDIRAFQHKKLKVMVEELLGVAGISPGQIVWKVADDPERNYLVQYRENDLEFLERILADEGLNYFVTCAKGNPVVLIADEVADTEGADLGSLQLIDGAHGDGVTDFDFECTAESQIYSTSDYNYVQADGDLSQAVRTAEACQGDWYEYPGGFDDPGRGATLAKRRAEARLSRKESATGRSEHVYFEPGKCFTLTHVGGSQLKWILVEVSHRWVLRSDRTNQSRESSYSNAFRAVPYAGYYRQVWPRLSRTVEGPLGAIATTQGSEEIHTDQYGEVTVRFFWDRQNPLTDAASCWLRVIQIPIGGSLAVARKSWEIMVRHLYGDPNRPILIARVDNAGHPAPYAYPTAGTALAWKTLASPGAAKINEFSMEDSGGRQGFSMTAGKDYTCQVNNNKTEKVSVNEEVTVDVDHDATVTADQKTTIGATWTKTVKKDASVAVTSNRTLKVGTAETIAVSGSLAEKIVGNDTETVGSNYIALAGMSVSKTSIGSQSLTVGGALITAAGLGVSQAVGGLKTEMIGGAKIVAAGGSVTESTVGAFSTVVGGVMVNAAGGNCSSACTSASKVKVGGVGIVAGADQVQLHAKNITIQVGAAAAFLGGGGIMALTAGSASFVGMVTIKASGKLKIKGAPNLPG